MKTMTRDTLNDENLRALRDFVKEYINLKNRKTKLGTLRGYELAVHDEIEKYFDLPIDIYSGVLYILDEGVPVVFSYETIPNHYIASGTYEKTEYPLHILWDVNQCFTRCAKEYEYDNLDRMNIFVEFLEKIGPKTLALEISCDKGQEIIDKYMKGELKGGIINTFLKPLKRENSPDDYSQLFESAVNNGFEVKAVDIRQEESDNLLELACVKDRKLSIEEISDEILKYRAAFIKENVIKLCENGPTLLILDAEYRPYLIDAFRTKT